MTDRDVRPQISGAPDVLATRFAATRVAAGYCIEQVDRFVGLVADEVNGLHEQVARLAEENERLTKELAEARRELDARR